MRVIAEIKKHEHFDTSSLLLLDPQPDGRMQVRYYAVYQTREWIDGKLGELREAGLEVEVVHKEEA